MSVVLSVLPEWLQLVSFACCIGVLVCSLWVLEPTRADNDGDGTLRGGMWQLLSISAATLFATSILGLLVRSAEMSAQPVTALFSVLPAVLLHTHLGHASVLRIAAALALLVAIIAGRSWSRSRLLQKIMLVCALAASATSSASGHASDTGDFSLAEIVDWLHLLPTMVWGGGLLVLSAVILPRLEKLGAACSMAEVAARFSRIAALGVALIMLTAPYEEWLY